MQTPSPGRTLIAALAAAAIAGGASAQLKREPPPQPVNWKAGAEARAYAAGPARIVRDWVWSQSLDRADGILRLNVADNTWSEGPTSTDALNDVIARVKVPADKAEYYVKFKRLRPVGERRPTMGGVMVNHDMFGDTDIGGPGLFPRLRAYVAVWGEANVLKNKKVIGTNRRALVWVGQAGRDADGKWLYRPDAERVTAHLVVWGSLGQGTPLDHTRDGFLHIEWPQAKVVAPGFTHDPFTRTRPSASAR